MLLEKEKGGYNAIQAQVLSLENPTYWQWAWEQTTKSSYNEPGEQNSIAALATIFDRDIVIKYRFDPNIPSGEDAELSYRLKKAGYRLGHASVGILHLHRKDFKGWKKQRIWRGKGRAQFLFKHKWTRVAIRPCLGIIYQIPFSLLISILRYRQPKLFPYLFLDGFFQGIGLFTEVLRLSFGRRSIGY